VETSRSKAYATIALCGVAPLFLALGPTLWAAPAGMPLSRLSSVFPVGGKRGSTVEVTLRGADLDGSKRLHFSHPGISAVPAGGNFTVTIGPEVPLGLHELRAVGRYGVSNPRAFVVGARDETVEKEPNDTPEQATEVALEMTVNGKSERQADVDYFRFQASKAQRIVIDCSAARIDSKFEGVIVVYDAAGFELERSRRSRRGDPCVDFTVPADGQYLLKVHDGTYRGKDEEFAYRVTLGTGPHLDFILPPCGLPGKESELQLYGRNLPGGEDAPGFTVDGKPLQKLSVTVSFPSAAEAQDLKLGDLVEPQDSSLDGFEYRLSTPQGASNPLLLSIATGPVTLEAEPNNSADTANKVQIPCEFVGQFYPRFDEDWVTFDADYGEVYWIEVFSERLGSPTDPYLILQQVKKEGDKETVKELQRIDDLPGNLGGDRYNTSTNDPGVFFPIPEKGTYRILVHDAHSSRDDPRFVYRLSIRRQNPDFRLVAMPRTPNWMPDGKTPPGVSNLFLRKGGSLTFDVLAFRLDGFDKDIEVKVEGLPAGVTCPERVLSGKSPSATVFLTASGDVATWEGEISVVGRAKIGDREVVRQARYGSIVYVEAGRKPRARMTRNLTLGVSGTEWAPLSVNFGEQKTWEMSRAGKLKIPVTIESRLDRTSEVILFPIGLPPHVEAKPTPVKIALNATEGALELEIKKDAPLGDFPVFLAVSAGVKYKREAPEARAAVAEKNRQEKIVGELAAQLEAATKDKAAADGGVESTVARLGQADEAIAAAQQTLFELSRAKPVKRQEFLDAGDGDAGDGDAGNEKTDGEDAPGEKPGKDQDRDAELKALVALLTRAIEARTAVASEVKAAEEARGALEKAVADVAARLKVAKEAFEAVKKRAEELNKATKIEDLRTGFPSAMATLKLTPAPVKFREDQGTFQLGVGSRLTGAIDIERLYGFDEAVELHLELPGGKGVTLTSAVVPIPKGQSTASFEVVAAPEAASGTLEATLRAKMTFNGQALEISRKVSVVVGAAP